MRIRLKNLIFKGLSKVLKNTNLNKNLNLNLEEKIFCDINDHLIIKNCDPEIIFKINNYLINIGFSNKVVLHCEDSRIKFDQNTVYFEFDEDFEAIPDNNLEIYSKNIPLPIQLAENNCKNVSTKFAEKNINFGCDKIEPWVGSLKDSFFCLNNCKENIKKFRDIILNI